MTKSQITDAGLKQEREQDQLPKDQEKRDNANYPTCVIANISAYPTNVGYSYLRQIF